MTPAILKERRAAYEQQVDAAMLRLAAITKAAKAAPVTISNNSQQCNDIEAAAAELRECFHRLTVVSDGLQPYTDPDFYRELPPSLALEDQGQHARNRLEQAFPE